MNNLLRTLTESRVKPPGDLKLLLTAVKETRKQEKLDSKPLDVFTESLDNLLADLRTISIDNRDAEAFLKPVSRAEVPDYYDYITNPMDFQTMARKIKQKAYKSKREFQDDLDLIWSNCYKYNAVEDHPLRQCVDRLKAKAERLLKYITDRKDRQDPPIPFDLAQPGIARPKVNGIVHKRTASIPQALPAPQPFASTSTSIPFAESPALMRTAEGMSLFRELDRGLLKESPAALDKLKELTSGDKRKVEATDERPRKRARFELPDDLTQLWWDAVHTDSLIANGLPDIPYAASTPRKPRKPKRRKQQEAPAKSLLGLMNDNIKTLKRVRQAHAKISVLAATTTGPEDADDGGFSAGPTASVGTVGGLTFHTNDEDAVSDDKIDERHWVDIALAQHGGRLEIGEENAQSCTRWVGEKVLEHAGFQGTSRAALDMLTGVFSEFLFNMGRSIKFLTDKYSKTMTPEEIILHTLFESGVSKVQELERYVTDDIERNGVRLVELEKKLVNAYREATAGDILEEEGLFEEDEEEEAGALALGDFADGLGEDYLGLRELGIAQEFGLSSLSIPKSLLRRKKAQKLAAAKPTEKPLDYPLPPPMPPLTYSRLPDTIGLLRPYYEKRFELRAKALLPQPAPPTFHPQLPTLSGPTLTAPSVLMPPPPPPPSIPGVTMPNLPGPTLPGPKLQPPPVPAPTTTPYPPNPYPTPASTTSAMGLPQMPVTTVKLSPQQPTLTPTPPAANPGVSPSLMPTLYHTTGPQPPPPVVIPPDLELPDDPIPYAQAKMGPIGQIAKASVAVTTSKKKGGGGGGGGAAAGGSSSHTSSYATSYGGGGGGGMGTTTTTFIPTIIGPNGQLNHSRDGSSYKKGGSGEGSAPRGPGRPPKKKDPPAGLVLPVSATTSQASSNGGSTFGQGMLMSA